jgi:NAD(P)-dependent dehydrogenase (short-subunit alcohol dehydrogenase family)
MMNAGGTFAGRTAIVTGAGSGIGAATARLLAVRGAMVFCADLDHHRASSVARDIQKDGGEAEAAWLDVTDEHAWISVIDQAVARFKRLDILVNSAGVSFASPVHEMAYRDWRRVFAINLDGVFLGMKHAIRVMRDSGGVIVNVSSASGIKPAPGASAYSTSKSAVCMFTRAVAKELRESGVPIRVNSVCPAGVKTPMWTSMPFFRDMVEKTGSEDAAYQALAGSSTGSRFSEPGEIAEATLYLASDAAAQVTGLDFIIDGGYTL